MDAFDADVLIYAGRGHSLGRPIQRLFDGQEGPIGVGSVLLLAELLPKPIRSGDDAERTALERLLARLHLVPVDATIAEAAVGLGARYGLKAIDAVHLSTAMATGAERFLTNNRRDFRADLIDGIEIVYPDDLAEPSDVEGG